MSTRPNQIVTAYPLFQKNSEEGMRMWADGDSCPQCGWVGPADKNEVVVFHQCAACDVRWLDRMAFQERLEILRAPPMFRVRDKHCPICGLQGDLLFTLYTDRNVMAVQCDEWTKVWLDPKSIHRHNVILPEDPWLIVPEIQCSVWNSRRATSEEIVAQGWEEYIEE